MGTKPSEPNPLRGLSTNVGHANAQRVTLRGHDLVDDLLGHASYTETLLLTVTGRRPSSAEVRAVDAVLVSLVDHGMQPSALASRLTYAAAPDAVQGAMAAGLLGAGSSLLGAMEQTGKLLHDIGVAVSAGMQPRTAAKYEVERTLGAGQRVSGFGHRLHRDGDPRARRLLEIAAESGVAADATSWLAMVGAEIAAQTGRNLAVNATGASAAVLLGVGVPWQLHRGVAIVSRAAGLLAHIGEEVVQPITPYVRDALREASWLDEDEDAGNGGASGA